ncbi:uncharacterized protein Dere_GG27259 [Drosophila erecta]|uniref:Uncharacterized protein n=1 Tax=Drosophila erecta TaxID=7220 RepID=A0A0Q5UKC8_DROER|nr:uncharacterized protein Dere_GG27259 [Drosophila erecta]
MATMTSAFPFKIPDDPLQAGSRPNSCSTNPNIHPVIAPTEFSDLSFWESFSSNSPYSFIPFLCDTCAFLDLLPCTSSSRSCISSSDSN